MSSLKRVKTIGAGGSGFSLLQALAAYVFGGNAIREYDSNKVYNEGDTIIRMNPSTGLIEILKCAENGVTGPFDLSKWEHVNVNEVSKQQETAIDDLMKIVSALSPFIAKPLELNNIYVDDFSDPSTVNILKGIYQPGKIII